MSNKRGKLIVIEGSDYSGKSSLIESLEEVIELIFPNEKFLFTREPGNMLYTYNNFEECEEIRRKLKTTKYTLEEQISLFAKSRELHTKDIISAINDGYNVICDRYLLSSIIYQTTNLGYQQILTANKPALDLLTANDITVNYIILQMSYNDYKQRKNKREESLGIMRNYDPMEDVDEKSIIRRVNLYNDLSPLKAHNLHCDITYKSIFRQTPEASTILALNQIKNILKY